MPVPYADGMKSFFVAMKRISLGLRVALKCPGRHSFIRSVATKLCSRNFDLDYIHYALTWFMKPKIL